MLSVVGSALVHMWFYLFFLHAVYFCVVVVW